MSLKLGQVVPELIIERNIIIGYYNHITCINEVYIGKNVLTADRVYITDHYHSYEDIETPIRNQPIKSKGKVFIGDNTWIGENVFIISCRIGKHCVIGANSVVNKDIPDYSVAVGPTAKAVKKCNFINKKCIKVQ